MISELPDDETSAAIDRLMSDSVREILRHEDPQRYLNWLGTHITEYLALPPDAADDAHAPAVLAHDLGRQIWNVTPLPGNHFRPKPLPQPGRNQPCPCGSGRKYKHCCARAPHGPQLPGESLWPWVLRAVPADRLKEPIRQGEIPVPILCWVASDYQEGLTPRKGVALLEPLFEGEVRRPDEDHDQALNLLFNLYDDLGYLRKKMALLERVIETQPRSPLRAGAWQRLATIKMDSGDRVAAWEAFHKAHRDHPDSVDIGLLEIQLLVSDNKIDQARERARFWRKRLRRLGYADDDPHLEYLQQMIEDPLGALAQIGTEIAGGAGELLNVWVSAMADRPIPAYTVSHEPAQAKRRKRVSKDTRQGTLDLEEIELAPQHSDDSNNTLDQVPASQFLIPPEKLRTVERDWHRTFPLGKPLSVEDGVWSVEDIWTYESEWVEFLWRHPDACDSLDILDDLVTALMDHPQFGAAWLDRRLLQPLLSRARTIIETALSGQPDAKLLWSFAENRPNLRSLARSCSLANRLGDTDQELDLLEWLLRLNPEDNHGMRGLLANAWLQRGEDLKVVELTNHFPDDMLAETTWGRVLALFRLGRHDQAQEALCKALEHLPKVLRHITHQRVKRPKIDDRGVQVGGDDQAWLYREEMRDTWIGTPGCIDWLKKASKRCTP